VVGAFGLTAGAFVALLAERGKPARLTRKEIGTLTREAIAKVVFWVTAPLGWGHTLPRPTDTEDDPALAVPVLLLPGAPQGRNALGPLGVFLRRRGFRWVWPVSGGRGGLAERARGVAAQVELLCREAGQPQVDIVAHGVGGLVAGWYLHHLGGATRVRRLVTLGTPWAGTRMAVFTRGPLGPETLPDASLLDGLTPPAVPTVCVWGSLDPMVLPRESAVADGAVSVRLSGAGHLDLLLSARAYRAVQAALGQPLPEAA
jgi:pimeloyl-ACP methyl ester carboxylesterase